MLKRVFLIFMILMLACPVALSDEEASPVGKWYAASAQVNGEYVNARSLFGDLWMEILADGSCAMQKDGTLSYGTWKMQYGSVVLTFSAAEYEATQSGTVLFMSVEGIFVTFLTELSAEEARQFDAAEQDDFTGTWYLNYMEHFGEKMPVRSSDRYSQSDVVLLSDGTAEFYTAGELTGSYRWSYLDGTVRFLMEDEEGRLTERTAGLIGGEMVMLMSEDMSMVYGREEVLADIE